MALLSYRGVADAVFGITPFYIPGSNPDGVDVNLNCLDKQPPDVRIVPFDGGNWEANAHTLAHKSQDRG